jgi:deoxyribonuclease-4
MPHFGAHMSISGGYEQALIAAHAHSCDAVQLFTKSPNQWAAKPITAEEAKLFRLERRRLGIGIAVGHDSYLINLASPDPVLYRRSIEAFIDEVQRAELLGLKYLVTHPGAHMGDCAGDGLMRVCRALDEVHRRCPDVRVRVLLETTAGQGTCLGARFEDLQFVLKHVREPKRLGVCLDTCHVVAAGYALHPVHEFRATFLAFEKLIGLRRLKVFHFNDSMKPVGSRVDRHQHIGQGFVGIDAFRRIVRDPRFAECPMILETPKESPDCDDMDAINLGVLRRLAQRRRA